MITAIVLYDLPPSIGLEECRAHFSKIAPDFLKPKASSASSSRPRLQRAWADVQVAPPRDRHRFSPKRLKP